MIFEVQSTFVFFWPILFISSFLFFKSNFLVFGGLRPETWDHAALSDSRDAIKHIRKTVGKSVPMLGVGFSFGGCMLTAIAGSVPQEEHGLCGLVSISGLFDMSAMMTHIAEQYAYPYGFANTKVRARMNIIIGCGRSGQCGRRVGKEYVRIGGGGA